MSHYPSPNEKTWQCFQMFSWVEAVSYEKKRRSSVTEAKVCDGKAKSACEHTGSVRPVQVVLCRASWSYPLLFCSADRRNINNLLLLVWVAVCRSLSACGTHISHGVKLPPSLDLVTVSCSYQFDRLNNLEVIMCFLRVLSWGLGWAMGSRAGPGLVPACSLALWSGESCRKRQMETERPEAGPGLPMQNSN